MAPGSIHGISQTQQKLLMLQLWRGGFPINPERVAKALGIENWGTLDGTTDLEKWQAFKRIELEFQVALKRKLVRLCHLLLNPALGPAVAQRVRAEGLRAEGSRQRRARRVQQKDQELLYLSQDRSRNGRVRI